MQSRKAVIWNKLLMNNNFKMMIQIESKKYLIKIKNHDKIY